MSHNATNWAIKQRGLKPATKIVLWHLCDRHHPDNGCFPSQVTLAADCEMSRSTLNLHLNKLEEMGLIRRHQSIDDKTKKQRPTQYFFAFENAAAVSENRTEAVSEFRQKPCPKNSNIRVLKSDTNTVIGTSKLTSKNTREEILDAESPLGIISDIAGYEAAQSFLEYRKKHKAKALTKTGARRLAVNLREILSNGGDPSDALGLAEERGWASVQPDWYFKSKGWGNDNRTGKGKGLPDDPTLRAIAAAATAF